MAVRVTVQAAFGHTIAESMVQAGHEDEINPVAYPDGVVTWTDITQWVTLSTSQGISIARGASDELSQVQPGTASMTLDNQDGRFTSGNAASPYHPNVVKQVPLRVVVTTLAGVNWVTTPSFEDASVRGWYRGNPTSGASFTTGTTRAFDGTESMRITWDTTGDGGRITTDLYGLDIGQTYTASAYVYVETGEPAVQLGIDGGATGTASATNDAWERITVTWTATAAGHTLQLTPTAPGAGGVFTWLDAVQVEEGASATAFDSAGAQVHARGVWLVNEWPTRWEGLYATATITCTDLLKRLSREGDLYPMVSEEMLLRGPAAHYPLGEPEESTSAGDIAGNGVAALAVTQVGTGGTLTFGEIGGPVDTLGVPRFTPVDSTNGLYLVSDLGQDFVTGLQAAGELWIEVWFHTETQGRAFLSMVSDDGQQHLLLGLAASTGVLTVQSSTTGPGGLSSSTVASGDLADGELHHVVYHQSPLLFGGGDVYIDGGTALSVATADMTGLRHLAVGGWQGQALWQGRVGQVALYTPTESFAAGWLTGHYATGTTEEIGEAADERMERIAAYVGLTVTAAGTTFDGMASQAGLGGTPLSHMQDIEATEGGRLFADRGTNSLTFQSRDVRYNPTAAVSLNYADLDTDAVEVKDDDQKIINVYEASRPGGGDVRIVDTASIDQYGRYRNRSGGTLLKDSDNAAVDAARWAVQRFADPPPEIRQVPVEASTLPVATYRALLDADISTALDLTGLPSQAPAATATVTVEGYTETILQGEHRLDFHTSRTDTDSVWVLDDAVYSVLGTTTRLAY